VKTTPLTEVHRRLGAKMVPFAGFLMPLHYGSITAEHLAVREGAGVFDVSHMGEFWIEGPEALAFLEYATTNRAGRLKPGRAQYTMLPNDRGGVVDDAYLYRPEVGRYLLVVNAANIEKDWRHLTTLAQGFDVRLEDKSDATALLALQGPKAAAILGALSGLDLSGYKKNAVFPAEVAGKKALVARTGYTGEDGFEVFLSPEDAEAVFLALVEAGAKPAGLGARDTLRLEMGYPLYGHELTDETNPRCTPFAWAVKEKAPPFYGQEAMFKADCSRRLVGLVLEKGIPREGYPVLNDGTQVGRVTSGTRSPVLKKGIALAWVGAGLTEPGTALAVEIRGRAYPAVVSPLPFIRR